MVIDVNSGNIKGGKDVSQADLTLKVNRDAVIETARQLRLRDIGGIIVIDFIDMNANKNQREVENRLKEALQADRARIQVGRISRFGLLEMSRQRLRLSLGETEQDTCPRCEGRGTVRNIQSHSLSIVRLIEEEALKDRTAEVQIQLPVEMATFICNEKRDYISSIEKRHGVTMLVIATPYLQMPNYLISRVKEDNQGKTRKRSYELIQQPELEITRAQETTLTPEPIVKRFVPTQDNKQQNNFIKRLWDSLFGAAKEEESTAKKPIKPQATTQNRSSTASSNPGNRRQNQNRRRRPSGNQPKGSNNPQAQGNRNRRSATGTPNAKTNPANKPATTAEPQNRRKPVKQAPTQKKDSE